MSGDQKTSSEILNELFSTFNSTYKTSQPKEAASSSSSKKAKKKKKKRGSSSDSDVDSRLKKSRKLESKKDKKKKKHVLSSPSTSTLPVKKKKKLKPTKSSKSSTKITDDSSVPIGDGFVILKKSKVKEVEDGEIIDDGVEQDKKRKRKDSGGGIFSSSSHKSSGVKKLSASQAYKLDEEAKLLSGYDVVKKSSSSSKRARSSSPSSSRSTSSSSHHKTQEFYRSSDIQSSSSSSSSRHRDSYRERSRSPKTPRLAPPRESYKNSYMKFQKQREYEEPYHHSHSSSSSRSYDTAGYYDYNAERSRDMYDSGRGGFGYVGKSYYYDDVQDGDGRRERDSSRESRDRDRRDESRGYGTSSWRHRHRSRSKSPLRRSYYHPDDIIDKTELLEIARKNAKKLMKSGVLPSDIFSRDQILALKAGGKSVDELTKYCKRLARRDAMGDATDACGSDSDGEGSSGHFIHHPFQVKDKPLPTITLNIRNAVPLPVRTPQQLAIESVKLRTQFPVSSGTQHRFQEIEWKPVKEDEEKKEEKCRAVVPLDDKSTSSSTGPNVATVAPMMKEVEQVQEEVKEVENTSVGNEMKAIEAPPPPPPQKEDTGITVDGPGIPAVDIGSVIGLRLKAMRMLQENPGDGEAKVHLDEATKMMKHWADAKALEPKFLTATELSGGPQAWAKRDQLRKTRAINSGMGMHLLQKMGWRPGEGLGKNNEGQLEPLALDVKTDKKGLTAAVEELMYGKSKGSRSGDGPSMPVVYDLSGKHPVSALMELTAKRRWGNPEFELCFEHGPPHKRQFVYKVIVNGIEYQPCVAVGNKKQAKANAAAFCLQSLGLLPSGCSLGPGELLQTVGAEEGGVPVPQPVPPPSSQSSGGLSEKFGNPTYLQTVQVAQEVPQQQPRIIGPQDPSLLMPPPPVPPPVFK